MENNLERIKTEQLNLQQRLTQKTEEVERIERATEEMTKAKEREEYEKEKLGREARDLRSQLQTARKEVEEAKAALATEADRKRARSSMSFWLKQKWLEGAYAVKATAENANS